MGKGVGRSAKRSGLEDQRCAQDTETQHTETQRHTTEHRDKEHGAEGRVLEGLFISRALRGGVQ